MSRIKGPRRPGPFARVAYWMSKRDYGQVPEPLEIAAHHPGLLRGYGMFEWETGRAGSVDEKLKDLAMLKAAALIGCEWCLDIGSALGRKSGVTDDQIAELPRYATSDAFGELERLVIDYAVAMTSTPAEIPDELFDALRAHFDERQLVELTAAIAIENYRSRFNWAFGIGSQGFAKAGVCALPERPEVAAGSSAAASV
jgi:4-carboxymuconolactone decarboxylase